MSDVESTPGTWQLDLAEDIDLPGWVWLPQDLEPDLRGAWVAEVAPVVLDLIGAHRPDGTVTTEAMVRDLLEVGLDARSDSASYMMYMTFPVRAPVAVMCHVNLAEATELPDWDDLDGRMQPVDARHIGPGVQISTEFTAETDHGPAQLASVAWLFADDEAALIVNLEPALPELVAHAMVGAGMLMNALSVTRPDGREFHAAPSTAPFIGAEEWAALAEGES